MELPLLQVYVIATLVILVSGASLSPRSIREADLMRNGGGGGGGGGGMGGIGGGFGGGGFGGGGGGSSSGSEGGQTGEDEESEGKGMGWGGGGGGGSSESSEGQTEYDEDSDDEDNSGQGDDEDNSGQGDDEDNSGQGDDEDNSGQGDDDEGQDSSNCCNNDDTGNDGDDDDDEDNDGDHEELGDGGDGERGYGSKSSISSDDIKRSIKSSKSPDMGGSSIPNYHWLSSGKNAPRSYYWEYYNDDNLVSGGSDDIASHRPLQDVSNIVTVIPWVFTKFMRGLTLKIASFGPMPRSVESLPRFKNKNMVKSGECYQSGTAAEDSQTKEAGDSKQEDSETDMNENTESEELETAEEGPSEAGMGEDVSSASDELEQESQSEEGGTHEEEFEEGSDVEEGGEILDESSGTDEIPREVLGQELEIAQEAMNPAMLNTLMLESRGSDSFPTQARTARSMDRHGAEVIEDMTFDLKSDLKSTGTRMPVDVDVSEPRNTRDSLVDSLLANPLVQMGVGLSVG